VRKQAPSLFSSKNRQRKANISAQPTTMATAAVFVGPTNAGRPGRKNNKARADSDRRQQPGRLDDRRPSKSGARRDLFRDFIKAPAKKASWHLRVFLSEGGICITPSWTPFFKITARPKILHQSVLSPMTGNLSYFGGLRRLNHVAAENFRFPKCGGPRKTEIV